MSSVVTNTEDFQQRMASMSYFKMNTVTENYWHLCNSNGNMTLIMWGVMVVTELI